VYKFSWVTSLRLSPNRQQLKLTIWLIYFRFNVSDTDIDPRGERGRRRIPAVTIGLISTTIAAATVALGLISSRLINFLLNFATYALGRNRQLRVIQFAG